MRVIAGKARGHRLLTLKGEPTRPTQDRVKESVFNILSATLSDARVLDLFAGSGALSIEALSRGAASARLVESSRAAARVITQNLERTGFRDAAQLWVGDALEAISRLSKQGEMFDLIFVDPPYDRGLARRTLRALAESSLLTPETTIVVEHSRKEELDSNVENLQMIRQRSYGDTLVSFYRPEGSSTRSSE